MGRTRNAQASVERFYTFKEAAELTDLRVSTLRL
jgi:hypothetical protein